MYKLIGNDTWEKFVNSRNTHDFLAKIQKEKENKERNIYPHILSRGEYDKEKRRRELELGDPSRSLDCNPSPPSCHEKWKRAHQTSRGEYTSEATQDVAEKFVSR